MLIPVWKVRVIPVLFELHIVEDTEEDLNDNIEYITQYVPLKFISKDLDIIKLPGTGLSTSEPQTGLHKS